MIGWAAGRHEHQPLDLPAEEVRDELPLAGRVAAGVAEHDPPARLGRGLLDAEGEVAVVRVAEVRDGDADEPAGLAGPEAPRVLVPAVPEFANRREHPLLQISGRTFAPPARVRDTVIGLTPACSATSLTVGCLPGWADTDHVGSSRVVAGLTLYRSAAGDDARVLATGAMPTVGTLATLPA